ncbi:MAG: hypothetical protein PVSMB1_19010 [Gemmatimonadaceae bacterium]
MKILRIAYVVMAVIVGAQGFFEPARTATIPNVTSAEELLPANALSSGSGSTKTRFEYSGKSR